jgi:hypothetical protein
MAQIAKLAALIRQHIPKTGMLITSVPRLSLFRANGPTVPLPAGYEASLCLIA